MPAEPRPEWGPPQQKTITWFDTDVISDLARELSGREFLQGVIEGRFPPPPICEVANIRLTGVGDGKAELLCTPDTSFLNPQGLVHGGLICTLLDMAMGVALQSTQPILRGSASIEIKVSFLRPAPHDGRELTVRGRVLQVDKNLAFADGRAYDPDGELIAHATSSLALSPGSSPTL